MMQKNSQSSVWLPALVLLATGLMLWWGADLLKTQGAALEGQALIANRLLERKGADSIEALQARQQKSSDSRQTLMARLKTEDSIDIARAELYYQVRQKCYEVKLNCVIRLSEMSESRSAGPATSTSNGTERSAGQTDAAESLSSLGVQRVRAVVSGALGAQELTSLLQLFQSDLHQQWMINKVQLKGRGFELDLERHVITSKGRA